MSVLFVKLPHVMLEAIQAKQHAFADLPGSILINEYIPQARQYHVVT